MPKTTAWFVVSILLAVATFGQEPPPLPATVAPELVALHGLHIGDSRKTADAKLGSAKHEKANEPIFCDSELSVDYRAADAYFCNGRLVSLSTKAAEYKTPSGIHVGMPLAQVVKLLGQPEALRSDEGELFAYRTQDRDLALMLAVIDGVVVELQLWCDFT